MTKEEKEGQLGDDFLRKDIPDGNLHRYSFDVRA